MFEKQKNDQLSEPEEVGQRWRKTWFFPLKFSHSPMKKKRTCKQSRENLRSAQMRDSDVILNVKQELEMIGHDLYFQKAVGI